MDDAARPEQEHEIERSFALIDIEHLLVQRGHAVSECLRESGHDFHAATFVITAVMDLLSGLGYEPQSMLAALEEFGHEGVLDRVIRALGGQPPA